MWIDVRHAVAGSPAEEPARGQPAARRPRRAAHRRAASTLQVILALPVLVIATLAVFEFGVLVVIQQAVTTAATEGARAAAKENNVADANAAAVAAVNGVLLVHNLMIIDGDPASDTRMALEFGLAAPVDTGDPGLACTPPVSPVLAANEVRVTVCVDLTTAPLLNFLSSFGFDLTGKRFEISSHAGRET